MKNFKEYMGNKIELTTVEGKTVIGYVISFGNNSLTSEEEIGITTENFDTISSIAVKNIKDVKVLEENGVV